MSRSLRPINAIQWLTLILVAIVCGGFIYGFTKLEAVQAHQNDALRSVLCRAEHVVRTEQGITKQQRHQAERFYVNAIKDAHLKPCGEK